MKAISLFPWLGEIRSIMAANQRRWEESPLDRPLDLTFEDAYERGYADGVWDAREGRW